MVMTFPAMATSSRSAISRSRGSRLSIASSISSALMPLSVARDDAQLAPHHRDNRYDSGEHHEVPGPRQGTTAPTSVCPPGPPSHQAILPP